MIAVDSFAAQPFPILPIAQGLQSMSNLLSRNVALAAFPKARCLGNVPTGALRGPVFYPHTNHAIAFLLPVRDCTCYSRVILNMFITFNIKHLRQRWYG